MSFVDIKSALVDATGLSRDALHIHLGLIILLAVRLIWHGRTGWLAAWFVTMSFTVVGEFSTGRWALPAATCRHGVHTGTISGTR